MPSGLVYADRHLEEEEVSFAIDDGAGDQGLFEAIRDLLLSLHVLLLVSPG